MVTSSPRPNQPDPIKKSHEQSLADEFNEFLTARAEEAGRTVTTHSLDGDDRDVGADYVLSDKNRFAIVEFKWLKAGIRAEARKPRRLTLCQELHANLQMTSLHDRCHYVAWSEPEALNEFSVHTNIYRFEVCIATVFGTSCTWSEPPARRSRNSDQFAQRFIEDTTACTLSKKQFDTYLAWVKTETSGSREPNVELITSSTRNNELILHAFTSVGEMKDWVYRHSPAPSVPQRSGTRARGGRSGPR